MRDKRFKGRKKPGRKRRPMPKKPLVLIVCEGKITEPCYFEDLRKKKRIVKERIRVISSDKCKGNDPLSIVNCALEIKREMLKNEGLDYDKVWCVFDRDEHTTFQEAIIKAKAQNKREKNFNLAVSVPNFELWYLLHFKYQSAHIERGRVCSIISKEDILSGYTHGTKGVYDKIKHLQQDAIKRAEKLIKFHNNNQSPKFTNPFTTVHELVKFLENLTR